MLWSVLSTCQCCAQDPRLTLEFELATKKSRPHIMRSPNFALQPNLTVMIHLKITVCKY